MFLLQMVMMTLMVIVMIALIAEAAIIYIVVCIFAVCVCVCSNTASNSFFQQLCNLNIIIPRLPERKLRLSEIK